MKGAPPYHIPLLQDYQYREHVQEFTNGGRESEEPRMARPPATFCVAMRAGIPRMSVTGSLESIHGRNGKTRKGMPAGRGIFLKWRPPLTAFFRDRLSGSPASSKRGCWERRCPQSAIQPRAKRPDERGCNRQAGGERVFLKWMIAFVHFCCSKNGTWRAAWCGGLGWKTGSRKGAEARRNEG
jgi:hypothetical protein